jgi:hypothetical protein
VHQVRVRIISGNKVSGGIAGKIPWREEFILFEGRVDEIHSGGVRSLVTVRSGEGAWVLTLEVLWTS